ncbi:MAG: ABC transporter ATP-binding protein [Candidatus Aminicenantes bacterium]|nr:ABC transporter ATP-binding protein [Candidatus Aminicenantes bacterium]
MADFLALNEIVKVYGTTVRTTALRGITLSIEAGEYAALIGRSGSGKSTLLNLIGTLDRPTSGAMRVDGRDVFALDDDGLAAFRSRTIGFVFQFHHLLPEFTAFENVLLPFRAAHGRVTAESRRRAGDLLEQVGVGDRMNNKSANLSGGQQQRVAIARALINQPRLILADEPTGNLDTESSEAVKSLLRTINRESGTTFIIVTHDRHIAAGCDRVIEIDDGRIIRDFRPAEVTPDEAWADLAPCECRERLRGDLKPAVIRP